MAIAKLSIDLEARLAGLQAGLDKAGVLAQKASDQIEKAFSGSKLVKGVAGGTLLADFLKNLGRELVQFVPAVIDGLDKLNDLSDATGASVENLSALEDIALRTGTSMDTAGDAVIKMNKALADAKPGTDQAAVFKALGLSVEELKRLDPVEAFQRLAIALQGYADDGNKARLVQELFGKSLREVAPLLKDAAEKGKLNATVTAEQAKAAEAFNKEMFALQKNVLDAARAISGPLIVALNQLATALKVGGSISGAIGLDKLPDSVDKVVAAYRLIGLARERITPLDILKNDPTNERALADLARIDAKAKGITASFTQANDELKKIAVAQAGRSALLDAGNPANLDARDLRLQQLPSLPDTVKGDKGKGKSKPWEVDTLQVYQADQLLKAFEAMEKINSEWKPVELFAGEASLFEAELLRKAFEEIKEVNDKAADELRKKQEELDDIAKKAAKDAEATGKDVGLVFASAAGEALTKFEDLRGVLKGILADINQIFVRELVSKPLEKFLTPLLKGFNIASLFGSANGNAFGPAGVIPFARGGIVNSPTLFPFAKGTGLMGEAGPEAILPLQRGRGGKLGVAASGGGASVNYAPVINIDSRSDVAQVGAIVSQALQADRQQLFAHLKAQGALA
jgi:hypothetical protein